MVKERPILFSAEMVRAILGRRKFQTRRVVKPQPHHTTSRFMTPKDWGLGDSEWFKPIISIPDFKEIGDDTHKAAIAEVDANPNETIVCPYGKVGDRLWVREAHSVQPCNCCVRYRADEDLLDAGEKWQPSIFMPRRFSRITLEITGVRVEPLQGISEADARAEGVEPARDIWDPANPDTPPFDSYRMGFADLWDKINGKKHPWASNPWVWVIAFTGKGL